MFAEDSNSRLGKIKMVSQGQFSISPRDNNNPHIQKIRVVSDSCVLFVGLDILGKRQK